MSNQLLARLTAKKAQLDKLLPLPPNIRQQLIDWYQVELTYSSNAIEGNTLSRLETAQVLEHGLGAVLSGKPLKDQLEALNHAEALDHIEHLAKIRQGHQFITEADIQSIHALILKGIDDSWAGKYRQIDIYIRGSDAEFPSPQDIPHLMDQFIAWLRHEQGLHPAAIAAEAHYRFVTIHPFIDGNGRTARLLMNLILKMHGYPPAIIRHEDRTQYLESFDFARKDHNRTPFNQLVYAAVERSLDAYLQAAQGKSVLPVLTQTPTPSLLRIGALSQATGESTYTLRYWLKEGLIEAADTTPKGYQLFSPRMIDRVKHIRQLQTTKRLTLKEIKINLGLFT
jgi:Fic family protein